ncbi:MAG: amino acid permease [Tepidisphaeraceae bacterium]
MAETSPSTAAGADHDSPQLVRAIGPAQLVLYGLGSMLGAGIYALIGTAAGELGNAVWLAFVVSMIAALLTGLSYACVGSRYPKAGGAAYVTDRAYRRPMLTYAVGLAVACSGLASMATGARAIGNEIGKMGLLPGTEAGPHGWAVAGVAILYLLLLAGVVYRGIRESMALNVLCTLIEAGGLLLVIAVGACFWGSVNYLQGPPDDAGVATAITLGAVMTGAVLTFFSFIGFEDILNVCEEVREPRRNVPIGLIGAMLIATVIYMGVAITAVSVGLPQGELIKGGLRRRRESGAVVPVEPLQRHHHFRRREQCAAQLHHGVAADVRHEPAGPAAGGVRRVHPTRHTPHVAVGTLLGIIILLVLSGAIAQLAASTVLLLLIVFTIVNAALVVLKLRPSEPRGGFEPPMIVPILGSLVCALLATLRVVDDIRDRTFMPMIVTGCVVAVSAVLFLTLKPKFAVIEE